MKLIQQYINTFEYNKINSVQLFTFIGFFMNTPLCENSNGDVKSTASSLSAVCINDVGAIISNL